MQMQQLGPVKMLGTHKEVSPKQGPRRSGPQIFALPESTPSFADTYGSTVESASAWAKGKGKAKPRDVFDDSSLRSHSSVAAAVEGGFLRNPNLAVPRLDLQKMYMRSMLQDKHSRASLVTVSGF
ncbi:hypothetical protein VKT23_020545 [Stygiomarasmius scandens]|uniref:Uncharacterized protein n=1 Tax=Marasmiellus scandens TaxID=2682957 RepID=A0ABR1IIV5_9AGAR